MAQKPLSWSDRIARVSDQYKNALVSILDPTRVESSYDIETAVTTQSGHAEVWRGLARIQPVRLAVDIDSGLMRNPTADVRVRVQIPRNSFTGRVKRGWIIQVVSSPENPELEDYQLVVDAEVNSSWRASTTIECSVNAESEPDYGS